MLFEVTDLGIQELLCALARKRHGFQFLKGWEGWKPKKIAKQRKVWWNFYIFVHFYYSPFYVVSIMFDGFFVVVGDLLVRYHTNDGRSCRLTQTDSILWRHLAVILNRRWINLMHPSWRSSGARWTTTKLEKEIHRCWKFFFQGVMAFDLGRRQSSEHMMKWCCFMALWGVRTVIPPIFHVKLSFLSFG